MPAVEVIYFKDERGQAPVLEWIDTLSDEAEAAIADRVERLEQQGFQLSQVHAHQLRDGIYELRARVGKSRYRVFYFFHRRVAAVLTHGMVKKSDAVPSAEIDRAIKLKRQFESDPNRYTYSEHDEADNV